MSTRLMDLIRAVPKRVVPCHDCWRLTSPLDDVANVTEEWARDSFPGLPEQTVYRIELRLSREIVCQANHIHEATEEAKRNLISYVYNDFLHALSELRIAVASRNYDAVRAATNKLNDITGL